MASMSNQHHQRRRDRAVVGAMFCVLTLVGSVACAKGAKQSETPEVTSSETNRLGGSIDGPPDASPVVDGGELVFGIEADIDGIDPTKVAFSSSGHMVASAVFDPLATLDANGQAVPYLAQAIDHSDDYKTWTITIPTGVQFHDGTPLDANAVAANLEAYRESYITKSSMAVVSSVEAVDTTHVVVNVREPYVDFAAQLASQTGYVFAPSMLDDPNSGDDPIGTGPFVFQEHVRDQRWTFQRNANYWRAGLPHLSAIEYRPIPDDAERLSQLDSGDLDMLMTLRPPQVVALRESNYKRVENCCGEEDYLLLNTETPPFDNPIARQAVAYATNAAGWRHDIQLDVEQPANGPFAPGELGYLDDTGFPSFDLEKAKALVQQYEQETGSALEFEWLTQDNAYDRQDAQYLLNFYEQAGMKVSLQSLRQLNLVFYTATGNYQMSRFRLFSAATFSGDANAFWRSGSVVPPPEISLNFPRYRSAEVDAAISQLLGTADMAARQAPLETINRNFGENIPYVWLGRPVWVLAANARVNGIYAADNRTIQTISAKTWLAELWLNP